MSKEIYNCLEDRLLVRPFKEKELKKTEGGIIDPNVRPKPYSKGEVIAAGEGYIARDTGEFVPTKLAKGDVVIYGATAGMEIEIEKEDGSGVETVLIMREGDAMLFISKKSE